MGQVCTCSRPLDAWCALSCQVGMATSYIQGKERDYP
jgi:hypothetical protein